MSFEIGGYKYEVDTPREAARCYVANKFRQWRQLGRGNPYDDGEVEIFDVLDTATGIVHKVQAIFKLTVQFEDIEGESQ